MDLQLQKLRKEAGFSSREKFAEKLGIAERRLKAWERQEARMSFADAVMIADVLGCSLDELAGRFEYVGSCSDARQKEMNRDYTELSEAGKDAAAGAVKGIRITEGARGGAPGVPAVAV